MTYLSQLQAQSKKRRTELEIDIHKAASLTWCGSYRVYQRIENLDSNAGFQKQRNAIARMELLLLKTGGME